MQRHWGHLVLDARHGPQTRFETADLVSHRTIMLMIRINRV